MQIVAPAAADASRPKGLCFTHSRPRVCGRAQSLVEIHKPSAPGSHVDGQPRGELLDLVLYSDQAKGLWWPSTLHGNTTHSAPGGHVDGQARGELLEAGALRDGLALQPAGHQLRGAVTQILHARSQIRDSVLGNYSLALQPAGHQLRGAVAQILRARSQIRD